MVDENVRYNNGDQDETAESVQARKPGKILVALTFSMCAAFLCFTALSVFDAAGGTNWVLKKQLASNAKNGQKSFHNFSMWAGKNMLLPHIRIPEVTINPK